MTDDRECICCPSCDRPDRTFDSYQNETKRTSGSFSDSRLELATWALGVAGEAGEVADHVKKHLGQGHPLDKAKLSKELGDVLWYCAVLAGFLGIPLSAVAAQNIEKLRLRYPDGFCQARSMDRDKAGQE